MPGTACEGLFIAPRVPAPYHAAMGRSGLLLVFAALAACASGSTVGTADAPAGGDGSGTDAAADAITCSVQPCSILPQCGCGEANACDIDFSDNNGTACRVISTPGTQTSSCTAPAQCDAGFVCLGGSQFASCKKYCEVDADCGTPRGKCVITISANGTPIAGIPKACSSNCDPMLSAAAVCPANSKCGLFTASSDGMTHHIADCSPAGSLGQGGNCKVGSTGDDKLCASGHLCTTTDGGTTYTCRKICRGPTQPQSANADCNNQNCIGFNTPFDLAGVIYGVCAAT
jgi:hypothetical protein